VAVQLHAPPCGEELLFHVAEQLHGWNQGRAASEVGGVDRCRE